MHDIVGACIKLYSYSGTSSTVNALKLDTKNDVSRGHRLICQVVKTQPHTTHLGTQDNL